MKNIIAYLFTLLVGTSLSQKIDYNNFDNYRASKVLFEELNKFRDTITVNGVGRLLVELRPIFKTKPELKKLHWSDKVYNIISVQNCNEMVRQNRLFHADRTEWWGDEKNRKLFEGEAFPNYKNTAHNNFIYNENAGRTDVKFETYQEMAKFMIDAWEKSTNHRCLQRSPLINRLYISLGIQVNVLAACRVEYANNQTWFLTNIIQP